MKLHKHADLIKAWADGAEIEVRNKIGGEWFVLDKIDWDADYLEYRIKLETEDE